MADGVELTPNGDGTYTDGDGNSYTLGGSVGGGAPLSGIGDLEAGFLEIAGIKMKVNIAVADEQAIATKAGQVQ